MRVLILKSSSLGDIVHTLPVLTEAVQQLPQLRCDWVAEEAFAALPSWHPAVQRVIPIALRRWRRTPWRSLRSGEWKRFYAALRAQKYERVIDAQGLWKSALLSLCVAAPCYGFDRRSAREGSAALCYRHRVAVPRHQHAIERLRRLFAESLGYALPAAEKPLDYGLDVARFQDTEEGISTPVVFLHGASRTQKLWPEVHWRELCALTGEAGYRVALPWGTEQEHDRAERIAAAHDRVRVLPRLQLFELAGILARARAVVAVDSGLGHLSAALKRPVISLYGATDPALVGTYGTAQTHLRADAMNEISSPQVWNCLSALLARSSGK